MTSKILPLAIGEFYHVYNKSIADEDIFYNLKYLNKILEIVEYYRYDQRMKLSRFRRLRRSLQKDYLKDFKKSKLLIDIYSFSFMPNHFHFLLRQLEDNGIKKFLSNIQNSYAKCFNLINNRDGSLFLNSFKYKKINSEEVFIHVCRYIHLNSITSHFIEFDQLKNYPFSSYSWYLNNNLNRFINTGLVMNHFKSKENFTKFHQDQVDYQRRLKKINNLLLDG